MKELLVMLLITIVVYSVFPIAFALVRNKKISGRRYRVYCFIFNLVVHIIFAGLGLFANFSNITPLIIWTFASTSFGISIMSKKNIILE